MIALKKVVLKKIEILEDQHSLNQLRMFSVTGEEFCDYDSISCLRNIDMIFYSFGEDYNYKVRLQTLQYKKDLGEGGFGTV